MRRGTFHVAWPLNRKIIVTDLYLHNACALDVFALPMKHQPSPVLPYQHGTTCCLLVMASSVNLCPMSNTPH